MDERENRHTHRPQRIDVYVDGSWSSGGKNNPATAGGWGAVVRETYADGHVESWTPSGETGPGITSSSGAETYAAIAGLQAVALREEHRPGDAPMPVIILHTDQENWQTLLQRARQNPGKALGKEPTLNALADIALSLGAEIEYTSHNKGDDKTARNTDDEWMDIPHKLAARNAWRARLEKQDGEFQFGPTKLTAKTEEERDRLARRIYPINDKDRGR